jgi:hypothetical protein
MRVFWLVSVCLLFAVDASAQSAASAEDVEAAYIHKFSGYVEWPPKTFDSPSAPIVVGVAGSQRMVDLLSAVVAGRPVQGRAVEVRRLARPEQSADVQLVFVGQDAWKDLDQWAAAAKDRGVVVITDAPRGIERGATLGFVQSAQKVRFEASLPAAERSGVKLSARLLAVAERVVGPAP